jgi:hypothetical protein
MAVYGSQGYGSLTTGRSVVSHDTTSNSVSSALSLARLRVVCPVTGIFIANSWAKVGVDGTAWFASVVLDLNLQWANW